MDSKQLKENYGEGRLHEGLFVPYTQCILLKLIVLSLCGLLNLFIQLENTDQYNLFFFLLFILDS